jgi:hypothetical protein
MLCLEIFVLCVAPLMICMCGDCCSNCWEKCFESNDNVESETLIESGVYEQ